MANNPLRNSDGLGAGFATNDLNASAILEARSTTKGFLAPRMTTAQRDAITSPLTSLLIFNTTTGQYEYYNGTSWVAFGGGATPDVEAVLTAGNTTTQPMTFDYGGYKIEIYNDGGLGYPTMKFTDADGIQGIYSAQAIAFTYGSDVSTFSVPYFYSETGGLRYGGSETTQSLYSMDLATGQRVDLYKDKIVYTNANGKKTTLVATTPTVDRVITFPDADVTVGGGSISLAGETYLSLAGSVLTANPINLAGTATALQTARTIGTVTGDATSAGSSFDGSANNSNSITVTKINGTSLAGLSTGILKNTTSTGVPSIAVAADFPTLNQNTTGNAATVTTNANLTGVITSSGNATSIASQTGTGTTFVVDNTPTLITPNIGAATGTSLVASGNVAVGSSGKFIFAGNSYFSSSGSGIISFYTSAGGNPNRIVAGGADSNSPAWQRNGASWEAVTGNNGAFVDVKALNITANGSVTTAGFKTGYVAKTANYTLTATDYTVNCTANSFTATLPSAVTVGAGKIYTIVNSGAGTITIGTTSSQTFTNVAATPTTLTMATVGSRVVQSDGANWMLISSI